MIPVKCTHFEYLVYIFKNVNISSHHISGFKGYLYFPSPLKFLCASYALNPPTHP